MKPLLNPLAVAALFAVQIAAAPVPKAVGDRAVNLEHYLEFQLDGQITFACKEHKEAYTCESRRQKMIDTDRNGTTVTAFEKAALHFNGAITPALQKERFDAAMQEIEQTEQLRKKYLASQKPYLVPPSSPLQDALDRALASNLEQLHVDGLDIRRSETQTHTSVKQLSFVNAMKRTAKGAAFSERVLGTLSLTYTDAVIDTNDTGSFYRRLPAKLESWLETNDTVRADYVGTQLARLYAEEMRSPFSGRITLKTGYLGNDVIGIDIAAQNSNKKGVLASFAFGAQLHNASTVFPPARKPPTPGTPDFLFGFLHSHSSADGDTYRALLAKDKRFAGYIAEYDALVRSYFDKKLQKFGYSAVLSGWISQARDAISKTITGRADILDITVKNRNGMTVMQVFGLLLEQLMVMPPNQNAQPDTEKIIADTAASHLEVEIEAH